MNHYLKCIQTINAFISVTTDDFIFVTSTSEQPTDSCQFSEFGCCPDGTSSASGYNLEGCVGVDFDNCTYNENDTGNFDSKNYRNTVL